MNKPLRTSRRSFLKRSAAFAAGLSLSGMANPWAYGQTRKPLALCLCVGVNHVDSSVWGTDGALRGPGNDANAMAEVAKQTGIFASNIKTLTSETGDETKKSTINNVLTHIAWAAEMLRPGDLFLFTYSGHGSQNDVDLPPLDEKGDLDKFGQPTDPKDEVLCLYDGPLVDDKLAYMWSRFADNVRIIMFADACNSGTIAKDLPMLSLAKAGKLTLPKGVTQQEVVKAFEARTNPTAAAAEDARHRAKSLDPRAKDLHLETHAKAMSDQLKATSNQLPMLVKSLPQIFTTQPKAQLAIKKLTERLPKSLSVSDSPNEPQIGAKGLLFGACRDGTSALDGTSQGLFTETLLPVLKLGTDQSYTELFQDLVKTGLTPAPQFFPFGHGEDPTFQSEPLFKVG